MAKKQNILLMLLYYKYFLRHVTHTPMYITMQDGGVIRQESHLDV